MFVSGFRCPIQSKDDAKSLFSVILSTQTGGTKLRRLICFVRFVPQVCSVESKTNPHPWLVTGAHGQLGARLLWAAASRGEAAVGLGRADLDITREEEVARALDHHRPSVVLNTAAFTGVDAAESQQELAMAVNGHGVGVLSRACALRGIPMVHLSTAYVFGEGTRAPRHPNDPVQPLGAYGKSKQAGEAQFLASGVQGAVVRVSWLYDVEGHNFLTTMLRLAKANGDLKVVDDQWGVPTSAPLLAGALLDMASLGEKMPQGIWHYAHEGATTWHGFACEIVALAGWDIPVHRMSKEDFPTAAERPQWSVLDGTALQKRMGWHGVPWQEALKSTWNLRGDGGPLLR